MRQHRGPRVRVVSFAPGRSAASKMRNRSILAAFLLVGCGDVGSGGLDAGVGGGQTGRGVGGAVLQTNCGAIDESCPAERPFAGAPCAEGLTCEYVEDGGQTTWELTCEDGAWSAWASCELLPTGCQIIPPPAEACDTPFDGDVEAEIELGPAAEEAFRPFFEGEEVAIVWGAQGNSMLFYRVKLTGPELPICVALTVRLESPVFEDAFPGHETVVLRCGQSLSIYTIIPYGDCASDDEYFDASFRVDVQGVGSVSKSLKLPYEALCGFGS